jgi:CheY-like chemotaxis protein
MDREDIPKAANILLVEDNPGDVRLVVESMKESKRPANLRTVKDGVEAMAYLHREGIYANEVRPDIILLDLNLPRKNGNEVLAEIKKDPGLKRIPVIILTASSADRDIINSYDLNANCYITKPVSLEQFTEVIKSIENFWLTVVKLPPGNRKWNE